MSLDRRRRMIEADHSRLSIGRQCALVSISRSAFDFQPAGKPR
jgi:putative transposase